MAGGLSDATSSVFVQEVLVGVVYHPNRSYIGYGFLSPACDLRGGKAKESGVLVVSPGVARPIQQELPMGLRPTNQG